MIVDAAVVQALVAAISRAHNSTASSQTSNHEEAAAARRALKKKCQEAGGGLVQSHEGRGEPGSMEQGSENMQRMFCKCLLRML